MSARLLQGEGLGDVLQRQAAVADRHPTGGLDGGDHVVPVAPAADAIPAASALRPPCARRARRPAAAATLPMHACSR
ncbi:hypothetical protein [Coralloluteibacterium thermophilus]|uniref:Uncharacterized protein n=1 Tax=Coralloluteibacterium thermophilum TaxID=2707049 RepID=A0ABV9NH84_9GAMM